MGIALSAPITTLHVERTNTNLFNAAAIDCNGWRESQEDAHTVVESINAHGIMIVGVYDGHGGAQAAIYVQREIQKWFAPVDSVEDSEDNVKKITQICLAMDNDFLQNTPHSDGCTACIVLGQPWDLVNDKPLGGSLTTPLTYEQRNEIGVKLLVVNIGDSRAIIVKPDGSTIQCTEDHEPNNPVERSRIITAGGTVTQNRVDGSLALSRAIGDRNYKTTTSLPPEKQKVIAVPECTSFIVNYGDILAVCCDGIYETQAMDPHDVVGTIIHQKRMDILAEYAHKERVARNEEKEENMQQDLNQLDQSGENLLHLQHLMDPAIISRELIQESILCGSRDNHTAIIVSFSPFPQFSQFSPALNQVLQDVQKLPQHESIPGLLPESEKDCKLFYTDLRQNGTAAINNFINQLSTYTQNWVAQNKNAIESNDRPMIAVNLADFPLKDQYSLEPLVLYSEPETNNAIPPGLFQMLLSGAMGDSMGDADE